MSTFEAAESTFDPSYAPKVTLARDTSGTLTAVIEVEGLAPVRTPSSEETSKGITSLDPPTVTIADTPTRRIAVMKLLSSAQRALFASVASTLGATLPPHEYSAMAHRLSISLRRTLRDIGEDA